jgi:predicted ester cyclase
MKIENFDTGLKGQEDVENIIITPEENYENKQKVKNYLTDIVHSGKSKLDDNLNKYFSKDIKVNCFHPVNEFSGLDKFKDNYWLPLFESFPDLERRTQLIIGGTFRDKIQVASISTLSGVFKKDWLGIRPNNKMVNLRCCEIHELKNDKIVESHILIDVIDLIFQTGVFPIHKSRGAEGNWLNPINTDGVNFFEKDINISKLNLEQALIMQRSLNIKPELDTNSDEDLKLKLIDHPQAEFWHDKMIWYGPSGIGTARSLEGFVDNHQLPFRKTFKERNYWKLGHYSELGDGKFSLTAGWHSIQATYGSNDWLGYPPNNKNVTMRVMDFYHHDEGKIRENWVPIDIAHILNQIGVDIFQLIKKS